MKLFTIGFAKKTAEQFFAKLSAAGVRRIIDIRLNNMSQLAGFTKSADLPYFARAIGGMEYMHLLDLAPTQDMLDEYKKKRGDWSTYEKKFLSLMASRRIEEKVPRDILEGSCLLCSEPTPHHCHRRLVAEYLRDKLGNIEICHIE
jgi:uncharacterized protein (DUF488 family)